MNGERIRYYSSYSDDFVTTKEQEYQIPKDYQWVRKDLGSRFLSWLIYTIAFIFSSVYCRLVLHVRFKNKWVMRLARETGAFIYCNHTQPFGDVFHPALASFPSRVYVLVSPANYGIPVIGKVLPYLGALPVADSLEGMKKLNEAIEYRLGQKRHIVIYPEAHVWEYYTGIRPYPQTSFKYPVRYDKPVYCMTTTYQKRRSGKKPGITIYVDGPFYPDKTRNAKEQAVNLRDMVYECMENRSKNSTYEYIRYEKHEEMQK